ncbi:MAG: DUF4177 domain-containing protein [Ruminococcus sp.]|uniref:DUF4177 domain-containing protein n=1 Tax=Ruminococcus sp. TaxID=41978 RepID=UPI0025F97703|nr:DUF4177 domain-containing protein [Ruminococcus sp.]MCR5599487.1 DUF4177 domain-containing protein [Ruminococcus sp.]
MKYKYVRSRSSIGGTYYYQDENGKISPRQVIDDMAAQGYRYVGNIPVKLGDYGSLREYDMIFEYCCQ